MRGPRPDILEGGASRRELIALAGGLAATPWPALALQAEPEPTDQARLLENLLTRMAAEVDVGGFRKRLFVIDTGAERTALSDRLAAELGLAEGPPVLVHGITAAELTRTAVLPRLNFGGRRFVGMTPPVFAHDLIGADGLLGLDVLSRFRLTLDMRRRRVMMAASGPDVVERGIAFGRASRVRNDISDTRTGRFGQLVLTSVRVDDVEAAAFIDSGAQYSIGNRALMQAIDVRLGPRPRRPIRVYGVIGQSLTAEAGAVDTLRLARRDLGAAELLFADLHAFRVLGLIDRPALLLGADVLTRFSRVTLDYGRGRIALAGVVRRPPESALRSP